MQSKTGCVNGVDDGPCARANAEYDLFLDTIGSDVCFPQVDGTQANYCSMIPLPMALDTVTRRLQLGYYRQTASFRHDVATILSNCELFNGIEHEYTMCAAAMEKAGGRRAGPHSTPHTPPLNPSGP